MRFTVRAPHFKTIDLYQSYFSLLLLCKKETPDVGSRVLVVYLKSKHEFRLSVLRHCYIYRKMEGLDRT